MNTYLYKKFHSVHHRLYVPYAFGALYNHPLEGLLLDTLSAGIAEAIAGMTTREAMLLFSISTLKTVDDHCGYNLPWDPLQFMSGNNADYHDIHHQVCELYADCHLQGGAYDPLSSGDWDQIEFRTTILHSLGRPPAYTDDSTRH